MSYSIQFFAIDANSVSTQFKTNSQRILETAVSRIGSGQGYRDDDIHVVIPRAQRICAGLIPDRCDVEYFHALCWLAEVVSESIVICSFRDFRHFGFLDEVSIWPWFHRVSPPFAIPRCSDRVPDVGFIPVAEIERFALPMFATFKTSPVVEVNYARQELQEVMESLVLDRLDLLAVLL